jgi:hypothetical protein
MELRLLKKVLAAVLLVSAPGLAGSKHDVPPSVSAVPAPHGKEALCAVTVLYEPGRPTAVQIRFSGEPCEGDEVALAHALAAILAYQGPQTPL